MPIDLSVSSAKFDGACDRYDGETVCFQIVTTTTRNASTVEYGESNGIDRW